MSTLQKLCSLLTRDERVSLAILSVLMVVGGLLEVCGIGLVFPYIAVLQDSSKINSNPNLNAIYTNLGFHSTRDFCILMSLGLLTVFIAKAVFTLWMTGFQMRFVNLKQLDLGRRLLSSYLHRPYSFFLASNTSTLIGNLTMSVSQLCSGVLQGLLVLAAEGAVLLGVILFLLYLSPVFCLVAVTVVAGASLIFLRVVKKRVAFYATENDLRWKGMIRAVNEGIGSAKEIQVLGREEYFVDTYGQECHLFSTSMRKYSVLGTLPRVFLETLAIGGMVVFAIFALLNGRFEKDLFAVLAVFAVATVRIVPSANRILQAWNNISFNSPSVAVVWDGLQPVPQLHSSGRRKDRELAFENEITMAIESFRFPDNPHFLLRGIQLTIKRGETVAFIGKSGSGKTTLMDILLGFFPDFDGCILSDGVEIRDNLTQWRAKIGYIPQNIYLCDSTIAKNVAFGLPETEIDLDKVRNAVRLAGLETVVKGQAAGLDTVVGDRGIRLSGGERQRIGIARALYHDPDLLILDEATSALDNETERQIVDAILGLSPAKTVIVIAHRLSSVKSCDCVYLMQSGQIIDKGQFNDLAARHPDFVNPRGAVAGQSTQPNPV